jgi:hypothetical protein
MLITMQQSLEKPIAEKCWPIPGGDALPGGDDEAPAKDAPTEEAARLKSRMVLKPIHPRVRPALIAASS